MPQSNILMYTTGDGVTKIEVTFDQDTVWVKFAYTASDGKTYQVDFYNLDVIISVGYRVKSLKNGYKKYSLFFRIEYPACLC